MTIIEKIIELSKLIAASLLKDKLPSALKNSEIFNDLDKDYILKNLTEESLINERLNQANQISNKADWKKVKAKIDVSSKNYFCRYAAAAAIIIALVSTNYLLKNNTEVPLDVAPVIVKTTIIEAGSNKATLQLEDGSVISLEKGKTYQNNNIKSNGEELVFNPSINSKKEIVYNYVTIPRGGQFYIVLSDGTKVWLNSDSQLKIPVNFIEGETRQVELIYGEAYFDVSPSLNHKGSKFRVLNQNQEIEVLGTEFNIKAYKDEKYIYTTLVEGKIAVDNGVSKQNLVPNEQSILDVDNNSNIRIEQVDVSSEVSWKRGVFSFRDKKLKDISKVISRWYEIDIIIENKELENITFKGVLRKDQDLQSLLSVIKNLSVINSYEINDRQLILK